MRAAAPSRIGIAPKNNGMATSAKMANQHGNQTSVSIKAAAAAKNNGGGVMKSESIISSNGMAAI